MGEMRLRDDLRATALLDQLNAIESQVDLPGMERSRRRSRWMMAVAYALLAWSMHTTHPILLLSLVSSTFALNYLIFFFVARSLERKREKLTRQHSQILARAEAQHAEVIARPEHG